MYSVDEVLSNLARLLGLLLAAGGVAFVGYYLYYIEAIRLGFRDRTHGVPVFANMYNTAHDVLFVSYFRRWFFEVDHWLFKVFWVALLIFVTPGSDHALPDDSLQPPGADAWRLTAAVPGSLCAGPAWDRDSVLLHLFPDRRHLVPGQLRQRGDRIGGGDAPLPERAPQPQRSVAGRGCQPDRCPGRLLLPVPARRLHLFPERPVLPDRGGNGAHRRHLPVVAVTAAALPARLK